MPDLIHAPGDGSRKHYQRGCRCEECRAANTAYFRDRRQGGTEDQAPEVGQLADDDPGILDGRAVGPAWWNRLADAAQPLELLGVREIADDEDGGRPCPDCSAPMRWAGGYTALVCTAHDPASWQRDTEALTRLAARDDGAAEATGISPAERQKVRDERAEAADRIDGYLEQLARIPRGDRWRGNAARWRGRLEDLAEQYKAAATLEDVNAAGDKENRFFDHGLYWLTDYAGRIAEAARRPALEAAEDRAPRGLWERLTGRVITGEVVYDDDDDDDDEDQADGGEVVDIRTASGYSAPAANPVAIWYAGYDMGANAAARQANAAATAARRDAASAEVGQ